MTFPRPPRAGFTLIELIVSIGIGVVICATAFVAVRVSAQTIVAADRLSLENRMMRVGVARALDELDFWTSYDDPTPGSANQTLRGPGEPFHAFDFTAEDLSLDMEPRRDPTQSYEDWAARDARTWFRGDAGTDDAKRMGDFALISHLGYSDGGPLNGAHRRWPHRVVTDVSTDLGYHALIDYAPASMMYACILADGSVPNEFSAISDGGPGVMYSSAFWESRPHDFFALTSGAVFPLLVPDRIADPLYQSPDIHRSLFLDFGTPTAGWGANDLWTRCGDPQRPLPLHPAHWPELDVIVRHYAANARQWHAASVVARSPVTGQSFKLFFTHTATTLRGARRQRDASSGWSRPGSPSLDLQ